MDPRDFTDVFSVRLGVLFDVMAADADALTVAAHLVQVRASHCWSACVRTALAAGMHALLARRHAHSLVVTLCSSAAASGAPARRCTLCDAQHAHSTLLRLPPACLPPAFAEQQRRPRVQRAAGALPHR